MVSLRNNSYRRRNCSASSSIIWNLIIPQRKDQNHKKQSWMPHFLAFPDQAAGIFLQQTTDLCFVWVIKGCSHSSATPHRFCTSFWRQHTMKSRHSAETAGFAGNSMFTIFKITFSRSSVSWDMSSPNGFFPYTIWYKMTPTLQTSTFCEISGGLAELVWKHSGGRYLNVGMRKRSKNSTKWGKI